MYRGPSGLTFRTAYFMAVVGGELAGILSISGFCVNPELPASVSIYGGEHRRFDFGSHENIEALQCAQGPQGLALYTRRHHARE